MFIKKVSMLVTNMGMKKLQDNTDYCAVGLLSLDDGQKFDISVRDADIYSRLTPMTKITVNMDLSSSKYGLKLSIKDIVDIGLPI